MLKKKKNGDKTRDKGKKNFFVIKIKTYGKKILLYCKPKR